MQYNPNMPVDQQIDSISIIDFGLATVDKSKAIKKSQKLKYLAVNMEKEKLSFKGNLLFCAFKQITTYEISPFTDIESLFHISYFLLNKMKLPWHKEKSYQNFMERQKKK